MSILHTKKFNLIDFDLKLKPKIQKIPFNNTCNVSYSYLND